MSTPQRHLTPESYHQMPIISLPPKTEADQQMLYVIGASMLAGLAHVGALLYRNEPVPLRKAVGSAILTLCVGGGAGALCVSYWRLPGAVVAAGAVVLGFIGGPVVLSVLAKIGERALEKQAEKLAELTESDDRKDEGEGENANP